MHEIVVDLNSASGLPAGVTEAWVELRLGARSVTSEHAPVRDRSISWESPQRLRLPVPLDVNAAVLRLVGRRGEREVTVASVRIEPIDVVEQDVTLGVGARGSLRCTFRRPSLRVPQPGAPLSVADVVGSEPLAPVPGLRRENSLSPSSPRRRAPTYGPATEAKLLDLLTEFFALESTSAFTTLAMQNVAVGLPADASFSPFAKPKLPRAPRNHPQRWSVSGASLASPRRFSRRKSSRRTMWSPADGGILFLPEGVEPRQEPPTPPDGPGAEGEGRERLAAMKAELITSAHELRRRFLSRSPLTPAERTAVAGAGAAGGARVSDSGSGAGSPGRSPESTPYVSRASSTSSISLAVPSAAESSIAGELFTLSEALDLAADGAPDAAGISPPDFALTDAEGAAMDGAEAQPAELPSPKAPSAALARVRVRRRSSMIGDQPDVVLRRRVLGAFSATRSRRASGVLGESPPMMSEEGAGSAASTASVGYWEFVRICSDVLEWPKYVAHAVFERIVGDAAAAESAARAGTPRAAKATVSFEQLEAHLGGFRAIGDDKRRVFSALVGSRPRRPDGGAPDSRSANADAAAVDGAALSDKLAAPRGLPCELGAREIELMVRGVLQLHPGLKFLLDHDEFREAYVQTVTTRILFAVGGVGKRSIPWSRWRASELTEVLYALQEEQDINLAPDFFSYNDFYVAWCLFWELDEDEDSQLTAADLMRYNNYALSQRAVQRVLGQCQDRASARSPDTVSADVQQPREITMGYADFVRFLLAEEVCARTHPPLIHPAPAPGAAARSAREPVRPSHSGVAPPTLPLCRPRARAQDKMSPSSMRYWFTVLDVDGDGVIGRDDVRYFYDETFVRCAHCRHPRSRAASERHARAQPRQRGWLVACELSRTRTPRRVSRHAAAQDGRARRRGDRVRRPVQRDARHGHAC